MRPHSLSFPAATTKQLYNLLGDRDQRLHRIKGAWARVFIIRANTTKARRESNRCLSFVNVLEPKATSNLRKCTSNSSRGLRQRSYNGLGRLECFARMSGLECFAARISAGAVRYQAEVESLVAGFRSDAGNGERPWLICASLCTIFIGEIFLFTKRPGSRHDCRSCTGGN